MTTQKSPTIMKLHSKSRITLLFWDFQLKILNSSNTSSSSPLIHVSMKKIKFLTIIPFSKTEQLPTQQAQRRKSNMRVQGKDLERGDIHRSWSSIRSFQ